MSKREAEADPYYYYEYPIYSNGYSFGTYYPYYGGYLSRGCQNVYGSRVPCP